MSNDRSNEGPQEHVHRPAGIERRDILLGGTALLTATAFSHVANAQTPDSIKTRKASCVCGKLTVTTKGPDPERISLCSCKNCQKLTGSAFSIQATFPKEQVTIEGKSTAWRFPQDAAPVTYRNCSRTGVTCYFCPSCGSTVYYVLNETPENIGVHVGTFTDPTFPPPNISGFEEYRFPWAFDVAALPMPGGHHYQRGVLLRGRRPTQPAGVERGNWIHTDPKKGFFTILPFFTKAWRPSEVELVR